MKMTLARGRVAALLTALVALLAVSVAPASAVPAQGSNNGYDWSGFANTGSCGSYGLRSGVEVRLIQAMLVEAGAYSGSSSGQSDSYTQIDGRWGPATDAALVWWQGQHSLSADGCAGAGTWGYIQYSGHPSSHWSSPSEGFMSGGSSTACDHGNDFCTFDEFNRTGPSMGLAVVHETGNGQYSYSHPDTSQTGPAYYWKFQTKSSSGSTLYCLLGYSTDGGNGACQYGGYPA